MAINATTGQAKKDDLRKLVAKKANVTQKVADVAITAVFQWIEQSLVKKQSVQLPGVGVLKTQIKQGGRAYNLVNKQPIVYGPKRAVVFKQSDTIKQKLPPLTAKELELVERAKKEQAKD